MILSLYAVILAIDLFDVKPLVLHHSYASYNILQPCAIIVEADTYREVCNMGTKLQMIYWKGNDFWVGKLLEHPEIMTQGKTIEELEENMKDAYVLMALEDEIDSSEGMASLADTEGTMSLEAYLALRQSEPERTE